MAETSPWQRVCLAKSLLEHATEDTAGRCVREARAALCGATVEDILQERKEGH